MSKLIKKYGEEVILKIFDNFISFFAIFIININIHNYTKYIISLSKNYLLNLSEEYIMHIIVQKYIIYSAKLKKLLFC